MKMIGIKLADGSFYPILEEGQPCKKNLCLTTVKDNQTRVLVDLYRSKTGTMEDAEYVDSLQIENLVEHPNGEANISLNIALDENNKLSADMNDPETGKTSNSNVTLVSRTLEERLEPTNYELIMENAEEMEPSFENDEDATIVEDTFEETEEVAEDEIEDEIEDEVVEEEKSNVGAAVAGGLAAGGLLAAAALLKKKNEEKEATEEIVQDEVEENEVVEDVVQDDDFANESIDETNDFSENETADFSIPDDTLGDKEETSFDDVSESSETLDDLPDFGDFETTETNEVTETSEVIEDTDLVDSSDNVESFESVEESSASDNDWMSNTEESEFETIVTSDTTIAEDSLEMNMDDDLSVADEDFDKTIADDFSVEEPLVNDNELQDEVFEDSSLSSSDTEEFSLPNDFDNQTEINSDETKVQNDDLGLDLPDFSDIEDTPIDTNLDDMDSDEEFFDSISGVTDSEDNQLVNDNTPSNGINFSGLYDQETVEGDSSVQEDEVSKKTKAPVVICVICAIICIIATLLILFVVPSKYNLLKSRNTKNIEETQAIEDVQEVTPIEEVEIVPEAKEDEVVVVTEPEQVVPEAPVEPEVKPQNITYKIKWGDTLWDIADAYYKNPWRYRKIARYNNIKNPDYIISGTVIEIPVE